MAKNCRPKALCHAWGIRVQCPWAALVEIDDIILTFQCNIDAKGPKGRKSGGRKRGVWQLLMGPDEAYSVLRISLRIQRC